MPLIHINFYEKERHYNSIRSLSEKDLSTPAIKIYVPKPEFEIVDDGEESEKS